MNKFINSLLTMIFLSIISLLVLGIYACITSQIGLVWASFSIAALASFYYAVEKQRLKNNMNK